MTVFPDVTNLTKCETIITIFNQAKLLWPGDRFKFIFDNKKYLFQRSHDGRVFIVRRIESSYGIGRQCDNFTLTDLQNLMNELIVLDVHKA